MSTYSNAQPISPTDESDDLAEVIELPAANIPSFYQRNSGSLPKANTGITEAHRRSELPRPDNTEKDSLRDAVRRFLRR